MKRISGIAAALVLLAGTAAMTPIDLETGPPTESPWETGFEALDCFDCLECWENTHMLIEPIVPPGGVIGVHPHPCTENNGDCGPYTSCLMEEEQDDAQTALASAIQRGAAAERVRTALLRDDFGALRSSLEGGQDASHLYLNAERSAIQVLGCGGSVVAHFPLSKEQVASLTQ